MIDLETELACFYLRGNLMLVGDKIVLRAWSASDLPALQSLRNNLLLQRQLMTQPRGNSLEQVREWLVSRSKNTDGLFFVVASKTSDHAVGYIQIAGLDILNGLGRLGMCVAPESQGMGYGREAITLLEVYLHDVFKLRKLTLEVLADNIAALRLYSKHCFSEVGRLKEHFYLNHKYEDVVIMEKML
ncbi:MAG: GNAT family protein [Acidocella sp.]|nr:GNAT family protein [Acidocella sp.]